MSTVIGTESVNVKLTTKTADGSDVSLGTVKIDLPYTWSVDTYHSERHPNFGTRQVPVYAVIDTEAARKSVGAALI